MSVLHSDKENRRNAVLQAARQCLARFGFNKMTMDDVGKMVGLNKTSLYYYYPNKEALIIDVINTEADEFIDALRQKVESVSGCSKRIQMYLVERFRIYQRVINLHNISRENMRQVRPAFREVCSQLKANETEFINKILQYCVQKGEIAACDTHRIAGSILTIADAYKLEAIESPDFPLDAPVDYSVIEKDLIYTVFLIIEGLKRN